MLMHLYYGKTELFVKSLMLNAENSLYGKHW